MKTWHSIWNDLSLINRTTAVDALWVSNDEDAKHQAIDCLASHGGFRRRFLEKMSRSKLTKRLTVLPSLPSSLIRDTIKVLYLGPWVNCLGHFLDGLRLPHIKGILQDDEIELEPPSQARALKSIKSTRKKFGLEHADALVEALYLLNSELYCHLPVALAEIQNENSAKEGADSAKDNRPAAAPDEENEKLALPENQAGRFTTLDRKLIKSIVASVSEIEGALDEDEIDDLVDEVLALNVDRHQSYFHLGFLNAMKSCDASLNFPESNENRRAWYLAGAVSAHARRREDDKILSLLDEHGDSFKPLMSGGHDATPYALSYLVDALWNNDREAEIPRLTSPQAWGRLSPFALSQELVRTTDLLAANEAERAEPHLRLLERCLSWRVKQGLEVSPHLIHTVQRRRAHALRQRGDFESARKRLILIENSGPAAIKARVQADLGLLDAKFRSLSRICFPDKKQDLGDLASDLELGRERFLVSAELAGIDGGHGAYCLALQAVANNDSKAALRYAEQAEAFFASKPSTYARGGLLARARLLLGWSLATELERSRCTKAADCLAYAVRELGSEGLYLVEDAVAALADLNAEVTAGLAKDLQSVLQEKDVSSEGVMNAAAQRVVLRRSPEMRDLVLERAQAKGRSRTERFADALQLLEIAGTIDKSELAASSLDILQDIALRNPSSDQSDSFLALLEEDDRVSTGWEGRDVLDARLELHLQRGECATAASLLEELAHETLGREDSWAVAEAREQLIEIKGLGVEGMPTAALINRINAMEQSAASDNAAKPVNTIQPRGKVLFLGGTEAQARYADDIKESIHADYPHVELEFAHLGWSSNWGRQLDSLSGSMERSDAFVLMRFMRTMCGRQLRRSAGELGIPWIPCTGHGKDSVERAIRRAIDVLAEGSDGRAASGIS